MACGGRRSRRQGLARRGRRPLDGGSAAHNLPRPGAHAPGPNRSRNYGIPGTDFLLTPLSLSLYVVAMGILYVAYVFGTLFPALIAYLLLGYWHKL